MDRFRDFLKKAFSYPMLLHKTHPITAACIVATTVLFAIYSFILSSLDYSETGLKTEVLFCVCLSFAYFTVFTLCLESIRPGWSKITKYAVFCFFGLLSLFMGFMFFDAGSRSRSMTLSGFYKAIRSKLGDATVALYIGGLLAIALLLAVYFAYSHDVHQKFNSHVINIYSKTFFASIIYGVIQLGVIFLTLIVMLLLYDDAFNYLWTILILINGLFYIPAVIYAITHENENANMFIQVLVRYVQLIITLVGFVIIYIYMIKLVVTASVPSNSVFGILTALFMVSMPVSYMSSTFGTKGFLQKYATYCPLVFAPFILMQCYSDIVRIAQYGLTPKRYFGIAFILFEIVYIVYYMVSLKREKEIAGRNILLIICAFVIVTVFLPGISAKPLSVTLAKRSLGSYLEKVRNNDAITDREYMHASAAYDFLRDDTFGGENLGAALSDIDADTVKTLREKARIAADNLKDESEDTPSYESNKYGYFNANITDLVPGDSLDISGYSKLAYVEILDDEARDEKNDHICNPRDISVYVNDGYYDNPDDRKVFADYPNLDLRDFVSSFIELCEEKDTDIITDDEFDNRAKGLCVIDIDENARLYITDADISRNRDNKPVYIRLDGYMLIK